MRFASPAAERSQRRASRASRGVEYHVAFPPFPSVVFLPLVMIFGTAANDVLATVILGALAPALLLMVLRRLRERGLSTRIAARRDLADRVVRVRHSLLLQCRPGPRVVHGARGRRRPLAAVCLGRDRCEPAAAGRNLSRARRPDARPAAVHVSVVRRRDVADGSPARSAPMGGVCRTSRCLGGPGGVAQLRAIRRPVGIRLQLPSSSASRRTSKPMDCSACTTCLATSSRHSCSFQR